MLVVFHYLAELLALFVVLFAVVPYRLLQLPLCGDPGSLVHRPCRGRLVLPYSDLQRLRLPLPP